MYFSLEALGAVLGVVYIFWSEKTKGSVASRPPSHLSLLETPAVSVGTKAALTAVKTVIRWLRRTAVLALVCSSLGELVYSAWGGLLYDAVQLVGFFSCPFFLFVAAGAKIAPWNRLTTAIVLAPALVLVSFRGHVLSNPPPGVTNYQLIIAPLLGNYRHFTLETLGAVLGVVYIFWSEKPKGSVARVPPDPPPP